jgi:hypothetical protein
MVIVNLFEDWNALYFCHPHSLTLFPSRDFVGICDSLDAPDREAFPFSSDKSREQSPHTQLCGGPAPSGSRSDASDRTL